jgi:hypothetical protein
MPLDIAANRFFFMLINFLQQCSIKENRCCEEEMDMKNQPSKVSVFIYAIPAFLTSRKF